jgi:hypothetical protein
LDPPSEERSGQAGRRAVRESYRGQEGRVPLDKEAITLSPPSEDNATGVVDGIPKDPKTPDGSQTSGSLFHWVAHMTNIAPGAKLKKQRSLAAAVDVFGGTFSAAHAVPGCIWEFLPEPTKPYVQVLAQEVDWKFNIPTSDPISIVLTKFDGSAQRTIALKKMAGPIYIVLGDTPEADIVPQGKPCSDDLQDDHFAVYYTMLKKLSKHPIPNKPKTVALKSAEFNSFEASLLTVTMSQPGPPLRGGGANCPPALIVTTASTVSSTSIGKKK